MSEDSTVETKDFTPFKTIGLCFSGGGYRATFFALGVMSHLEQSTYKKSSLLTAVKALSTVSGGTLAGVGFAKALQEKSYNFKSFFKDFYDTFTPQNDELLTTAIKKFEDDTIWEENSKKRTLINAFALTYAEMPIFDGSFKHFKKNNIKQLEQVCFNATDFSYGLTFRIQNQGYFGNSPLYRSNQKQVNALRDQIILGDAIASSSCFPVGFEPMIFPDDYFEDHNDPDYRNLKDIDLFINGVGIMDGGIADNQGIGSMMLINERMTDDLDLIIVNDVGSYKMKPWEQDTTEIGNGSSLKRIVNNILNYFSFKPLYWITLIIGLLIIILNNMLLFGPQAYTSLYIVGSAILGIGLLLSIFGIVASILKSTLVSKIKGVFKRNVPEPLLDDILSFQKLDISLIQRMLSDRFTSAMTLINDVFMKQIRRLNYDLFYSKKELEHRRITATIYKLNGKETPYSKSNDFNKRILPKPSKALESVCLTASEMPTTLWWDKTDIAKNRMDALIACGQITICYELMDYILKLKADQKVPSSDLEAIDKLYNDLEQDWKQFNLQPLWLVDKLKR